MRFIQGVMSAVAATFFGVSASLAGPAVESGLMSLGMSQTARVNVANLLSTGDAQPGACQLSIRFLDNAGATFVARSGRPVGRSVALLPGQSAALELPSSLVPRGLFRTTVEQIDTARAPNPCTRIVITLEIYDNATGRTSVLEHLDARKITDDPGLQHADDAGPPDHRVRAGLSTPQFGLAGLVRLQRATLHVVNLAPADARLEDDACVMTMAFVDEAGAPIIGRDGDAVAREVSLAPGSSSGLDLRYDVARGGRGGSRRMFRPVLDAGSGGNCSQVSATLEIVDLSTGRIDVFSSIGGTVDSAEALGNNVPVTIDGTKGSKRFFKIEVPPGASDLSFRMSGGSGDADLYVKFGALPTLSTWDARPYLNGNLEIVSYPLPASGTWYVMVHAYETYADATLIASFTEPPPPEAGVTDLVNGVPVFNLSGGLGSQQFFRINVPSGRSTLSLVTSGGSGDADLYVRYGDLPTTSTWDSRPYTVGNNESVAVNTPAAGLWYVMIRGYAPYTGVTLTAIFSPPAP